MKKKVEISFHSRLFCKVAQIIMSISLLAMLFMTLPSTVNAEGQLDGVLGVQWGASPEQVCQTMEQSGFSYEREIKDPNLLAAAGALPGTYIIHFSGGVYAGYRVDAVYVEIMKNQMTKMKIILGAENIGGEYMMDKVFADLKILLSEKYSAPSSNNSYNMPVSSPPQKMYEISVAVFGWKLDGDKKITLSKTPGFVLRQMKFSGIIFVEYLNNGLYETLKTSSRQNI